MREKLSAFVITYNRAAMLESCLRAVSFADELIVVDKSSTDNSVAVAARYADRVEVVPWSPTVEETRAFALSLCRHEWVLFLDDDELLSPETERHLRNNLFWSEADIFAIPYRHYILGVHDERAYYWPETRHCLFRRGAIEFIPTVHGGVALQSDRIASIPVESGVCIHHLSYHDVASWIERTNRYTGRPDRVEAAGDKGNLIQFAHDQIDYWMQRTATPSGNDYPAAVALLRAVYDMVDRLKAWETDRGLDGAAMFQTVQNKLAPAIERREFRAGPKNVDGLASSPPRDASTDDPEARPAAEFIETSGLRTTFRDERPTETQAMLVQLRATEAQLRERTEAERKTALALAGARNELDKAIATARNELDRAIATARDEMDKAIATLARTRGDLDETRTALDRTRITLAKVERQAEQLSNSARLFTRQYLPKLRRHLLRSPT